MSFDDIQVVCNTALKFDLIPLITGSSPKSIQENKANDKRALLAGWNHFNNNENDKDNYVLNVFKKNLNYIKEFGRGVGIRTGEEAGIIVIDIDVKDSGLETFNKWMMKTYGHADPTELTLCARTGSGGLHLYFKYIDEDRPEHKLKSDSKCFLDENNNAVGIDVKTDGGYVIFPITWFVVNGIKKQYTFLNLDDVDEVPFADQLAEIPGPLLAELKKGQRRNSSLYQELDKIVQRPTYDLTRDDIMDKVWSSIDKFEESDMFDDLEKREDEPTEITHNVFKLNYNRKSGDCSICQRSHGDGSKAGDNCFILIDQDRAVVYCHENKYVVSTFDTGIINAGAEYAKLIEMENPSQDIIDQDIFYEESIQYNSDQIISDLTDHDKEIPEPVIEEKELISPPGKLPVFKNAVYRALMDDQDTVADLIVQTMKNKIRRCGTPMWFCNKNNLWKELDKLKFVKRVISPTLKFIVNDQISLCDRNAKLLDKYFISQGVLTFEQYCNTISTHDPAVIKMTPEKRKKKLFESYLSSLSQVNRKLVEDIDEIRDSLIAFKNKNVKTNAYAKLLAESIQGDESVEDEKFMLEKLNSFKHLISLPDKKVLDLKTKKLSPRLPEHYFTWVLKTKYNPNADTSLHMKFLRDIMCQKEGLVRSLLLVLGYGITGEVKEQLYFFFMGSGSNGKTALYEAIISTLETEGSNIADSFVSSVLTSSAKGNDHTAQLNPMIHNRMSFCTEIPEGKINQETIKLMSGERSIKYRKLGQEYANAMMTIKLFMFGNDELNIELGDYAMQRRFCHWLFNASFVEEVENEQYYDEEKGVMITQMKKDPDLLSKLEQNKEGFLKLMIDSAYDYYNGEGSLMSRLDPEVLKMTSSMIEKRDAVKVFYDQCDKNPQYEMSASDLYDCFKMFLASEFPDQKYSQTKFGTSINKQPGVRTFMKNNKSHKSGIMPPHKYIPMRLLDELNASAIQTGSVSISI
jgi:recombinational DNA repair ATPase RecF